MNQAIPRGGTAPLKIGDRVQIVPEWQDPGDDQFESFVIEAPPNTTQVRLQARVPDLVFHPTEWIEADHLIFIPTPEP